MKLALSRQKIPLYATVLVCVLLYVAMGIAYSGFFALRVLLGFLTDNAFLGVAAVGLTFVIVSGGIDLSVGAMIGCVSIMTATLVEQAQWHPVAAFALVLGFGTMLGAAMGALIRFFALPPFLVTLAGLFFCRGVGLVISTESISITNPFFLKLTGMALPLGNNGLSIPLPALIFIALLIGAIYLSIWTPFGRNAYAIGGSESSAILMGLKVGQTKIALYALSGFCSALAGVVFTLYTASGNAIAGTGLELDAVAAVVIGGTLLSGGVGYVVGTFIGVLIFGIIQTGITFQGTLSSWWTKIAVGVLLMLFILLQKFIQGRGERA
jgi:galactofuranose transport system permease protein